MAFFMSINILFNLFLVSTTFLKLSVSVDTLFPNQTISNGQTLVSKSQVFEMGFFSPGRSRNSFLGVWYKNTPDVVFWVANRNSPITDSQGVTFGASTTGDLVISSRNGSVIWSENPSRPASNPVLQLLDTGNLVLVNQTMEGGYIWQSFEHPTDTWVPGMKMMDDIDAGVELFLTSWKSRDDPSPGDYVYRIDNQGLPELVISRGKTKTFRTGKWNGVYFCGGQSFPSPSFQPELVFKDERLVSISRYYDTSISTRTVLDISGSLERLNMNSRNDNWNLAYTFPNDQCDKYGYCGPYGLCKYDRVETCKCFKGFAPKFKNDWELQDYSGGCTRSTTLNCENGDGFVEVKGVKYPDMLMTWINMSMSLHECKAECLKNCSCTAYANPYITNGGIGCVMWFGDLIDTREVPSPDSKQNIYIRLPISELDTKSEKKEEKRRRTRLILISIASGVLALGLISGGLLLVKRRKRREASCINDEDLELPMFKLATIMAATNNFSEENMLGEGGFGPVYKGNLSAEEEIAVKRLSGTSRQGREEFKNEVILIAKLQHRNLVRLLGCCIEGEERLLIYEYLQNKSLDCFLFDQNQRRLLTWPKRFDIIMGIARGMLYLHHDSRLKIIHRDLKASNILLDGNLNPKISDFGIARIFEEDQPSATTRRVIGTYGYMAPEYAIEGNFSVKSDVFSMGVVLLEIVSGKKNKGLDHHSLMGQAWSLWQENKILELMDVCLSDTFIESQVKRCIHVGLLCVQKFAKDRPDMSSVLFMLGTDGAILPEPTEPALLETSFSSESRTTYPFTKTEKEAITMTDLEGR